MHETNFGRESYDRPKLAQPSLFPAELGQESPTKEVSSTSHSSCRRSQHKWSAHAEELSTRGQLMQKSSATAHAGELSIAHAEELSIAHAEELSHSSCRRAQPQLMQESSAQLMQKSSTQLMQKSSATTHAEELNIAHAGELSHSSCRRAQL